MTSPANRQNSIPATNTSATTAASYASAAGAPKKSVPAPIVAISAQPPAAVAGASAFPAQNAKAASPSPVNGKSAITPAVPAVARGSLAANGSVADHTRKSSVTMAASGPNSYAANGGPVGGSKSGIQSNFPPQGGRGRGGFNPHGNSYNNQMGFPPNNQFRNGPGQGRGMPPSFQPQPRSMPYPNSPQPSRSPALVPSMPNTPNMASANMQPNMTMQTPPQYHYPPPMAPQHQNFGYPPQQMDQYGRPMSMPYGYNNMPYIAPPQANTPGYGQQYGPPPYHPQGHSMSRSPSQPERPSSASHQSQPVIVSSNTQPQSTQPNPAAKNFIKPGRKSAAIQIKNAAGEVVDTSSFKQPASPAPSVQQSKTPPVVSSTPTPPPKSSTPAHGRTDSQATPKTAKEIQDELKEKIKQATQASAESKPKDDKPVSSKEQSTADVSASAAAVTDPSSDKEEVLPAAETPKDDTPAAKAPEPEKPKDAKPAEAVESDELEEDEMERMIREMEEADLQREKEEEEHRKRKEAEKAAAKKKEEEDRKANAADADRKLREQEREMERLEEEKEKRQKESDTSGKALSVTAALAQLRSGKDSDLSTVDAVSDKLVDIKLEGEKPSPAADGSGQKPTTAEKRGSKPAALNLAPLNTKPVEPAQPSAALQSLKSARFLQVMDQEIYPAGIHSPNPALNAAVTKKGKTFKYDASFLLQFKQVFTEQPSVEFHQQVKSLIGDGDGGRSARAQTPGSARQGSRGGGAAFSMGTFAPPVRTLPPGTTSTERMAMASGTMPRPPVNSIGSFQRPGAPFPTSTPMSRTSSQSNMRNMPNSPRQSSRSTRGSRRNDFGAKEAQAAKTMPLTAGQEIKPIAISAGGWKPSSVGKASQPGPSGSAYLDPEMVQRKVKAALNKMTPEKFDRIADQILDIASQSKDESDGRTLRQVIQLTFEKATDEAHWASMYAKFCKRMLETMSPEVRDERIKDKNGHVVSGGNLFRKYLLNRCQEEFERGWTTLPEQKEAEESVDKKPGEAVMLSDEYYAAAAAKRRGLGLVQFIGELYKLGMLTERIMHECVHKLVDYKGVPDEAEIESLCKLLRTIGANLDHTEKGRPMMDAYFQRIQTMAELPELQSRMKFMLMDVIDLRRASWISKEANKGPKTLDEVRAEAEAAQAAKAQEAARNSQRGGGGRPMVGRGDARNFSAGYVQQTSNQVGMDDLRRLKGSASRPGEDSGASSRTGTPPTRDSTTNSNAFSLLANMETEHPASPPSAGPSPSLSKAVPDGDKKESE
ncbi:hypothetical protein CDD83_10416 [Cordyceps sp. RAO-2017]|nr:hypothetical protein CDD83_10416 [Cordyceps sp. RAO-2017]